MRALLVDSERLVLMRLKGMLERESGVRVVGMFDDACRVEEQLKELEPDIVFLDMDMSGMGGLELASRIRAADASIEIVFTGVSDQYAIDAYAVYPLDYMRKPVDRARLRQTIGMARLRSDLEERTKKPTNGERSMLVCLGTLAVRRPDAALDHMKWRTTKAQELFAYLLHHRGRMVERDTLFRLLWPGFKPERAAAQLYNTIYTVRAVLKSEGLEISISKGGPAAGYRLELGKERLDTDEWERELLELPALNQETADRYEAVLGLYTGDYMAEPDYAWALEERLRLRELWLEHMYRLVAFYRSNREEGELQSLLHRLYLPTMATNTLVETFAAQNTI